jgi:hypothetical protein
VFYNHLATLSQSEESSFQNGGERKLKVNVNISFLFNFYVFMKLEVRAKMIAILSLKQLIEAKIEANHQEKKNNRHLQ